MFRHISMFGEDKFVVLFGPFHIEQAFLKVIGQFMEDCGGIDVATNSGIITRGSAEAIMKVTHFTKSRVMHQVAVAVFHDLMLQAFVNDVPAMTSPLSLGYLHA